MLRRISTQLKDTMKPILFYDDRSPPVRSCLLLIKRLGIDVELNFIDLFNRDHLKSEFVKINPIHTVPTLKDGKLILTDSHSILIYLCEKFGKTSDLYPSDEIVRIKVINKLFFECSVLFRRDSDMMGEIFRGELANLEQRKEKIRETFSMIETFLGEHKYIACDQLTIADISVVTTVSTVEILIPIDNEKWPRLAKWYEEMKLMPHFKEINEIGVNKLKDTFKNFTKLEF